MNDAQINRPKCTFAYSSDKCQQNLYVKFMKRFMSQLLRILCFIIFSSADFIFTDSCRLRASVCYTFSTLSTVLLFDSGLKRI